jgi:hypothetical protein
LTYPFNSTGCFISSTFERGFLAGYSVTDPFSRLLERF